VGDAQDGVQLTKINKVMVDGVMHHTNATPATVTGPASALVATVQG